MQRFWTILMVLFLGVTLAGCAASKKKGGTVEVEDATIGGSGAEVITDASASAVGSDDATAGEIIMIDQDDADMDDPLGQRVVYFDFDSSNLTPEAQRVVAVCRLPSSPWPLHPHQACHQQAAASMRCFYIVCEASPF